MYPGEWVLVLTVFIVDFLVVMSVTPAVSRKTSVIFNRLSLGPYTCGVIGGRILGASDQLSPNASAFLAVVLAGAAMAGIHWILWQYFDAPDWLPLIHLIVGCGMGATLIPV